MNASIARHKFLQVFFRETEPPCDHIMYYVSFFSPSCGSLAGIVQSYIPPARQQRVRERVRCGDRRRRRPREERRRPLQPGVAQLQPRPGFPLLGHLHGGGALPRPPARRQTRAQDAHRYHARHQKGAQNCKCWVLI